MKILILSIILLLPLLTFGENTKLNEPANYQIKTQKVRRLKKRVFRTYITGRRGGCYYLNGSGSKTYVSRNLCRK